MKLKYTAQALNLYTKLTGESLLRISDNTGISYSTINRYARGERLPDIDNLLRICNTLHIRVDNFFIHPDIEPTQLTVYHAEEWEDITFRFDRIEAIRLDKQLTKGALIQQINDYAGCNITLNTYNHLIVGEHTDGKTILGLLGSQDVDLDYLFEQPLPQETDDSVIIPRRTFAEMKERIAKLEQENRELEVKNKRLEKKTLPRYQERMNHKDADKIIREFIRKVDRSYADLKSWIEDENQE